MLIEVNEQVGDLYERPCTINTDYIIRVFPEPYHRKKRTRLMLMSAGGESKHLAIINEKYEDFMVRLASGMPRESDTETRQPRLVRLRE